MSNLEVVHNGPAILGEGPVWDHRLERLIWVDIYRQTVNVLNPSNGLNREIKLNQLVGCAVPTIDQNLILVATQHGFNYLNLTTESLSPICDPELDKPGNRFNDGKADSRGRLWAGTMAIDIGPPVGSLYRLNPDLTVTKVLDSVIVSNGIAWSPLYDKMYYIDSPRQTIDVFDFDLESGEISNRRVAVDLRMETGFPDGMTIDEEGMLWIGMWDGWSVIRCNPNSNLPVTKRIIQKIEFPVARVTSAAFGGKNLDELFVTTVTHELSAAQLQAQPLAGCIFRLDPKVRGRKTEFFGQSNYQQFL